MLGRMRGLFSGSVILGLLVSFVIMSPICHISPHSRIYVEGECIYANYSNVCLLAFSEAHAETAIRKCRAYDMRRRARSLPPLKLNT